MVVNQTEFPVRNLAQRVLFLAQVISWIRGIEHSSVFSETSEAELREKDYAHIVSEGLEEFTYQELSDNDNYVIGVRYDYPDNEGRLWRVEAVICRTNKEEDHGLLKCRATCIAKSQGATLQLPRKPYLIKSLLQQNFGARDGMIDSVSDEPIWLPDSDEGLELAKEITLGKASDHLPVIYISSIQKNEHCLSIDDIQKLSYRLGGLAHVVVEPSRRFSFTLRDIVSGDNVYGGAVGVVVPRIGIAKRLFRAGALLDKKLFTQAIERSLTTLHLRMPTDGWDWVDLQERALSKKRDAQREILTKDEIERSYLEQINVLKNENERLKAQLGMAISADHDQSQENPLAGLYAAKHLGREIYSGEVADRVVLALKKALQHADSYGLDARTKAIVDRLISRYSVSPACLELKQDIERAAKDPSRMANEVTTLLARHGYIKRPEKKHVRLIPDKELVGVDTITLAKTPSDHRASVNTRKSVERSLCINNLR